jgi:hypothetical protein
MAGLALTAILKSLRTYGSRSSVLSPLLWLAFILGAFAVICVALGEPGLKWVAVTLAVLLVADVLLVLVMYVVFVARGEAHQLRSESYAIHHALIQKGLVGDNTTGLFEEDVRSDRPLVAVESPEALPPKRGDRDD